MHEINEKTQSNIFVQIRVCKIYDREKNNK